jgi:hypothetical protein
MYEFRVHTLVDITSNSKLQHQFPFEGADGELIHNKDTLIIAKNQNSNFNTLIQLLQIRGNITWENPPQKLKSTLGNTAFGQYYEGEQTSWHFRFFVEQSGVYGDDNDHTGQLIDDFNLVPINTKCKETAHFPISTFITKNLAQPTLNPVTQKQKVVNALTGDIINTYFSYAGEYNK